jgi:hypothetical protein
VRLENFEHLFDVVGRLQQLPWHVAGLGAHAVQPAAQLHLVQGPAALHKIEHNAKFNRMRFYPSFFGPVHK